MSSRLISMFKVGSQGIGKAEPVIFEKPVDGSAAAIMRRQKLALKQNDQHPKDKDASSELLKKT